MGNPAVFTRRGLLHYYVGGFTSFPTSCIEALLHEVFQVREDPWLSVPSSQMVWRFPRPHCISEIEYVKENDGILHHALEISYNHS